MMCRDGDCKVSGGLGSVGLASAYRRCRSRKASALSDEGVVFLVLDTSILRLGVG
jgi:hypothetical protein